MFNTQNLSAHPPVLVAGSCIRCGGACDGYEDMPETMICDPCETREIAAATRGRQERAMSRRLSGLCDDLECWVDGKFPSQNLIRAEWRWVLEWSPAVSPGLFLGGQSRAGKTCAAVRWAASRMWRHIQENTVGGFVASHMSARGMRAQRLPELAQFDEGGAEFRKDAEYAAYNSGIWILDDLGQVSPTENQLRILKDILDRRTGSRREGGRPSRMATIITSQKTLPELRQHWNRCDANQVESVLARLEQYFTQKPLAK